MFTLAMSDEIAQDEADAEDYDLESFNPGPRERDDDDDATLVGVQRGQPSSISEDHVVFEIGDEDAGSDGEDESKMRRPSREHGAGKDEERQGLIGGQSRARSD
jgi:hypothetical protein